MDILVDFVDFACADRANNGIQLMYSHLSTLSLACPGATVGRVRHSIDVALQILDLQNGGEDVVSPEQTASCTPFKLGYPP